MSLKWFEGFDAIEDAEVQSVVFDYTTANATVDASGRRSGKKLNPSNTAAYNYVSKNLSGLGTEAIIGAARYQTSVRAEAAMILLGGYGPFFLTVNASNVIEVRKGSRTGTIIAQSSSGAYPGNGVWVFLEWRCKGHASSGVIQVRVNGATVIDFSGAVQEGTNTGDFTGIGFYGYSDFFWDDVYVLAVDATVPNTFLGDVACESLMPNADGSTNDWTASAGSRYTCVDETDPNEDTDYVYASTAGNKQLFGVSLPDTGKPIKGVKLSSYCKKTDAGFRNLRNIFKVGANTHSCSDQVVYDSYKFLEDVLAVNPLTSVEFTDSDIDNGEFGVELRSYS